MKLAGYVTSYANTCSCACIRSAGSLRMHMRSLRAVVVMMGISESYIRHEIRKRHGIIYVTKWYNDFRSVFFSGLIRSTKKKKKKKKKLVRFFAFKKRKLKEVEEDSRRLFIALLINALSFVIGDLRWQPMKSLALRLFLFVS